MVKKASKVTRANASSVTKRRRQPEVLDEEERILREATKHLVYKHGMFLVATGVREARIKGFRVWIITVTFEVSNPSNEPVLIAVGVPTNFIHLGLDNSDGEQVAEYDWGAFWPLSNKGYTLSAKQSWSGTVDLPTTRFDARLQKPVPLDPGLYRLTMSLATLDETSPPCVIQIVPPGDAAGQMAGP